MSIEPRFLYIKVKIARPMATSAAATVRMKNTKILVSVGGERGRKRRREMLNLSMGR